MFKKPSRKTPPRRLGAFVVIDLRKIRWVETAAPGDWWPIKRRQWPPWWKQLS